jgi:phosphonopyruvate decarboxylase
MLNPKELFDNFTSRDITYFVGVPDSLLKDFCAYITDHADESKHVITANEGNAIALAAGYYLGTGKTALVYLQNSGLGNAINPLLSLNDSEVYGLPLIIMIGWRGEPGEIDEPQHIKQGRVTKEMLNVMEIPWQILDDKTKDIPEVIDKAIRQIKETGGPTALLVRKGTFEKYTLKKNKTNNYQLTREKIIQRIVDLTNRNALLVSTTGMASRELYEYRISRGDIAGNDFMTVGAMGHASSISLGLAQSQPNKKVVCIDGDGSVLMHMGGLTIIGQSKQHNLIHLVLNNGSHDSVGGQPTCAFEIDIATIALACGYRQVKVVETMQDFDLAFNEMLSTSGPSLLEIRINNTSRNNLGRPKTTPLQNRDALMEYLGISI